MFAARIRPQIDPDALSFAATSGATDIRALSDFARGIKNLGLWSSMVCWPLRSAQNAGTGTTAFSFGGLGTFNGTLVNGPTWGANGMAFVPASSNYISWVNSLGTLSAASVFLCTNASGGSPDGMGHSDGGQAFFSTQSGTSTMQSRLRTSSATYNRDRSGFTAIRGAIRSWDGAAFSGHVIASGGLSLDASPAATAGTLTPFLASLSIGRDSVYTNTLNGTFHFYAFFSAAIVAPAALYALYKSTLGVGLGLP